MSRLARGLLLYYHFTTFPTLLHCITYLLQAVNTPVERERNLREISRELVHQVVSQGRHLTIFIGRQATQDCFPRMDSKVSDRASLADCGHELAQLFVPVTTIIKVKYR